MSRIDEIKNNKEKIIFIKNIFPLEQVKKMIGKKLIIPISGLIITIQDKNNAKVLKTKILENISEKVVKSKNIIITVMYNGGILNVFKQIEVYLAICSISYKEMANVGDNIMITIHQYPKLTKTELKKIM